MVLGALRRYSEDEKEAVTSYIWYRDHVIRSSGKLDQSGTAGTLGYIRQLQVELLIEALTTETLIEGYNRGYVVAGGATAPPQPHHI